MRRPVSQAGAGGWFVSRDSRSDPHHCPRGRSPRGPAFLHALRLYRMARLFAPILGILASSRVCALCRSSTVRKPALAKARPALRVSPFCCQALAARQYSSNDGGLRLMMSVVDKTAAPVPRAKSPAVLLPPYAPNLASIVAHLRPYTSVCHTFGNSGVGTRRIHPDSRLAGGHCLRSWSWRGPPS
jgi:hypothetical protein